MPKQEPKERRERRVRCSICKRLFERTAIQAHREECEKQQKLETEEVGQLELAPVINLPVRQPVFLPAPEAQRNLPEVPIIADLEVQESARLPEQAGVAGWPLRRGRLSASALSTFQTCPEKFRRQYILGIYGGTNGAAVAGKAAHHAVEVAARYQIREGEPLPVELAKQAVALGFEHGRTNAISVDWGKDSEMDWLGRAATAASTYVEKVLPRLGVIGSEEMFLVNVAGVPVPLIGFVDLVTPQANIDLKTGNRVQNNIQPGWRIQGHVYLLTEKAMSWHSMSWKGEYRTPMDANLALPLTAANYQIGLELVRNTVESIMSYADRFGPNRYWPGALSHPWACSYCDFKDNGCPWWHPQLDLI